MYRIIGADEKEYGPISADQLRLWISEGRINAASKVRREEDPVWKTAGDFPELAPLLTSAPPPPPQPRPTTITYDPAPAKNNPLALWSMITGIVSVACCCNIIGPVSIILGIIGLSQIKKNPAQRGKGFAIAGIVLGSLALVMMIVSVITCVLDPQFMTNIQNILKQQ